MKIKFKINKSLKGQIDFSNLNKKKRRNIIIYGEKGLINYDGYSQKNNNNNNESKTLKYSKTSRTNLLFHHMKKGGWML